MNINQKEVINLKELSLLTGLSKSTLYKKTCNKSVPYFKLGSTLYFKTSEIIDWMLQNRVVTPEQCNISNPLNAAI
jgi:predicted DNA-binding transcriptional regulator AlpA